ncbi:hypothetical protein [Amycolatopsis sp. lyj-346]|uniref:hypothetical protein n=1 Tax=Amycolatopsis sp. lyj-346 TaxID=2789289 RepID=UPI00397E6375
MEIALTFSPRRVAVQLGGELDAEFAAQPGQRGRVAVAGGAQQRRQGIGEQLAGPAAVDRDRVEGEGVVPVGRKNFDRLRRVWRKVLTVAWATPILASVAWIVAHAAGDVDGTSATVAFGERVTAITQPGVPPAVVQEFDAPDGHHEFVPAMRALDGALRLTAGQGAQLVFVVSDGRYGFHIERQAADIVDRFTRHGVRVLWLDLASEHATTIVPTGAIPIRIADIDEVPRQVEHALVDVLRQA